MSKKTSESLIAAIDACLRPYSFTMTAEAPHLSQARALALWKRKTWNTNRAVALLDISDIDVGPGQLAQREKIPLGKAVGYIPFLYTLGLQVVIVGTSLLSKTDRLDFFVDLFNNQRVVLQSIHVVDLEAGESVSVRTWGQFVSGRFQDAIEKGIDRCLGRSIGE